MSDLTNSLKALVAEMPDAPTPDMVVEFPKVEYPVKVSWTGVTYDVPFSQTANVSPWVVLTRAQATHIQNVLTLAARNYPVLTEEEIHQALGFFSDPHLLNNMDGITQELHDSFVTFNQKIPKPCPHQSS